MNEIFWALVNFAELANCQNCLVVPWLKANLAYQHFSSWFLCLASALFRGMRVFNFGKFGTLTE